MEPANRSAATCSRRWFLTTLAAGPMTATSLAESPAKGRLFPSALERYPDPATDFTVFRLTDPQFTSHLPASYCRAVAVRGDSLIYASDMTGRFEAFRLDLKSGIARQLTEAEALDPSTVTFLPGDRGFGYLDGDRFIESNLASFKSREIYRASGGFTMSGGLCVSDDGQYAVLVERTVPGGQKDPLYRLQLVRMANGASTTLVESGEELSDPILRPRRASVLYRRGDDPWSVNFDARRNRRLRVSAGTTLQAVWSPDGRSVIYLNRPVDPHKLHNLREFSPDTNEDKPIADTTQFVRFGLNADASVFVGASGSKASPYVLLLVRAAKRELAIAEHRASDPGMVTPIFSPNSQQIFFVSDRHGKPAIYAVKVDKMVAQTEGG